MTALLSRTRKVALSFTGMPHVLQLGPMLRTRLLADLVANNDELFYAAL
jgi:hypothetical protein